MTTKIKSGVIADNAIVSAHISSGAISSGHLSSIDTDAVSEGSSNLYFTTTRARTSLSVTDSGGDGSLAYDNSTGAITYTGPSASEVRAHLSAGTGVTYSSGEFSIGQSVATTASPTFADINVTGNINVTGDLNTVSVTDLDVTDQTITLGAGQNEAASDGSGIVIAGSSASILWDEPNDEFDFNKSINVTGNIAVSGTVDGVDIAARDAVLTSTTTTAGAALPKAGGTMSGALIVDAGNSGLDIRLGTDKRVTWSGGIGEIGNTAGFQAINTAGSALAPFGIRATELKFATGSTTRLTIDASGNVGIGITSLNEGKLHVKSDGAGEVELLTLENSTGTNGKTTLTFKTTSTDATKSAQIFAERINASGHTDLAFRTYNGSTTERMRINSSGNVGIGDTDPQRKLQLRGDRDAIIRFENTRATESANQILGSLEFYSNDSSGTGANVRSRINAFTAGGGNASYLTFSTADGTTDDLKRMQIDSDGDISFYEDTGSTAKFFWDASEEKLGIGTGSDTLNGTLNVKGGVNSILAYSTVTTDQPGLFAGNNSAYNTSTNTLYAKIYGSGITASSFGVTLADYAIVATEGTDNNGLLIGSFNNAPIIFGTNNTNRMTLTADGKLNLNVALTKSSGPVLDLEPNANIDGSYYSALTINEQHSTAHSGVRFDRSGTPKYRVGIDNNDNFQIANFRTTTDDAAFVMDVDSDIGIGTASPASSLHIHRDSLENSPEIRITTGKDSGTPTAQMSYAAGSGYFLRLPDAANNEDVMIRSYGETVFHGGAVSIGDQLKVGSFGYGATNTGEAWIGRASDRNEGTLTVQLGGGTTGRKFEIVDHDWTKVMFNIDGNADNGAVQIPATGVDGITINNTHAGTEPYINLHLRSLSTIGGIGLYSTNQSHVRFKTGGGSGNWGNGQGYQWQLRMGKGAGLDNMQLYSWTGNREVQEWHGSTGNIEMPYQAGARYGLPSQKTVGTTNTILNFSDTNSNYGCYQRSGISSSSGIITVTHAGIYDIAMCIRTEATPFRTASQIRFMVDNSGTGSGTFVTWQRLYINGNSQGSYEHAPPLQAKFQLVAGARLQVEANTGSGSFDLSSTSNTVNFLTINKIA
ncbi:hypothetical protein OAA25_00645 [bacterium]|nr:hypothetical protein [bacterium]